MLPKELMDDCICLQNQTTPKPSESPQNTTLSNETMVTLDPLIKEMLATDSRNGNNDRRYGSVTQKPKNGDHFTSTQKPVTFKSFWDDIFATTDENTTKSQTDVTANTTLTTISDGSTTNGSTPTPQNATDLPFIWDFLTTETPQSLSQTVNQTSDRFTNKPTVVSNETLSPQSMSRLQSFTPGVEYVEEINGTTTTGNVTTASTSQPSSSWTQPFYRPERRRNQTETTAQNMTATTDTPLTIGSSYFRPTLKPILRPITASDESHPQSNTVPPYDRRSGLQRERTAANDLESRSRMASEEPIEQLRENQYLEQQIEPQFQSNRTQPTDQRSYDFGRQPYQRPPYRAPDAQPSPHSPQYNKTQGFDRSRPTYDSQTNRSHYTPDDYRDIEQKPYSATSWSHQQNRSHPDSRSFTPYSQSNRLPQPISREPKRDPQFNWWDSRYDPEVFPTYYTRPDSDAKGSRVSAQQPRRPLPDDRSRLPSQTRTQRPRVLVPEVVYEDDRGVPHYYRPAAKTGLTRPYYPPNATETKTYPKPSAQQSPYYRRAQQTPSGARKTYSPPRDVYSRPELMDRSYVPYYNPYMTAQSPPQIVVGEYPYVYNVDQPYHPSAQSIYPSDPYSRGQRTGPYDRRRLESPTKTHYDNIRRRGEKPLTRTDPQKPQTSDSDLKTISEIMESPDLMIGQKFKTFNHLKDLVNGSGLWDALNRPTTFLTIFMPTDEAFDAITDGSVEQLKKNPKLVKDFLTQHILGYSLPPQNLKNNMRVKSLNGEMHLINVIDGGKVSLSFDFRLYN